MMKKNLIILAVVLISFCLVGFAFDSIDPASTVRAAGENQPVLASTAPAEEEVAPLTPSLTPVAFVVIGLECVLFGIMAVSPLLAGDPEELLREANRGEM